MIYRAVQEYDKVLVDSLNMKEVIIENKNYQLASKSGSLSQNMKTTIVLIQSGFFFINLIRKCLIFFKKFNLFIKKLLLNFQQKFKGTYNYFIFCNNVSLEIVITGLIYNLLLIGLPSNLELLFAFITA